MNLPDPHSKETPWGITFDALSFLDALCDLPREMLGPSDVFFSRFGRQVDELEAHGLIKIDKRFDREDGITVAGGEQVVKPTPKGRAVARRALASTLHEVAAAEAHLRSFDPPAVPADEAMQRVTDLNIAGHALQTRLCDIYREIGGHQ